ncbi:MAG TPA: glycosyltransferase family 39 protein, partial [Tepidisphaeraceae bacterium]|nr:glycosyltransferase family 39 protein [Tepidisphaeraceae bacterium]
MQSRSEKFAITSPIILAILLVAALLRIYHIGYSSIWIDEIASLQFSCGWLAGSVPPTNILHDPGIDMTNPRESKSLGKIWHSVDDDTHPPIYFLLLHVWRNFFGPGDVAARSLSVVCSIISILLLYDTARLLHGQSIAIWAAAIMAVATPQIVFAQEARGYAMVTMFILAMANAIARIEILGESKWRLIALAIATFAAAMTHYLAIPAALALGIYIMIRFRGRSRWRALAAMSIAAVFFLMIWGHTAWNQRSHFQTNLSWLNDSAPGIATRTLDRLASLPLMFFITPKQHDANSIVTRFAAVLYFIPLIAIRRRGVLLWILIAAAIIATTA